MNPSPDDNHHEENLARILASPSYRLVAHDTEFLARSELRPLRMQLELLKPEMTLEEHGIRSTIVVFGGTRIVEQAEADRRLEAARAALANKPADPALVRAARVAESLRDKAKYYECAREFARIASSTCQVDGQAEFVVVTGGGPGVMEAANRGAYDLGAKSIGLNITLPAEQLPNPYITPSLCFQFQYFALRKFHFLLRAKALVIFPGGYGTLDELTDALTLRQTGRMQAIPIVMVGEQYWRAALNLQFLADEGMIDDSHLQFVAYAETAQEIWDEIKRFHALS